jgi:hypothetical protein
MDRSQARRTAAAKDIELIAAHVQQDAALGYESSSAIDDQRLESMTSRSTAVSVGDLVSASASSAAKPRLPIRSKERSGPDVQEMRDGRRRRVRPFATACTDNVKGSECLRSSASRVARGTLPARCHPAPPGR